ncbi:protein of unknown function [Rhodovastum atsumiense]|nr:protein of unknown function [Rhodovastum atsumiense]
MSGVAVRKNLFLIPFEPDCCCRPLLQRICVIRPQLASATSCPAIFLSLVLALANCTSLNDTDIATLSPSYALIEIKPRDSKMYQFQNETIWQDHVIRAWLSTKSNENFI